VGLFLLNITKILFTGVFSVEEKYRLLNIYPRHRADYGIRWRTRRSNCAVPRSLAAHKSVNAKGAFRINSQQSAYILRETNTLVAIGIRKLIINVFQILFIKDDLEYSVVLHTTIYDISCNV